MSTAQAVLFDLAPDYWYRLQETREKLMRAAKAPNTSKAYEHAWKVFSTWCAGVRCQALPAQSATVSDFVTWCLYERQPRFRLKTVRLTLSAITIRHTEREMVSPVTTEVRELVRHAARDLREREGGKDAVTPAQLRRICAALSDGSAISTRDRAMILVQFAAGWRCSEVAGLNLEHLRFTRKGFILTLGASKTDQDGSEGRLVGIDYGEHVGTCPVRALRAWLQVRGSWSGPLFCRVNGHGQIVQHGLIGDTLNERLKLALCRIGVDPVSYGSHSLRAGMVTAGIERGASETLIMMRTGHKSLDTMRRYVRSAGAFRANPLAGVL